MKYFDEEELVELLKFTPEETTSQTLEMINKKHPFHVTETPSIMQNIDYLNSLDFVEGVTNHASLFSKEEDEEAVED
jgi:hypothetical protein